VESRTDSTPLGVTLMLLLLPLPLTRIQLGIPSVFIISPADWSGAPPWTGASWNEGGAAPWVN